jgi:hypothetical protein
VAVSAPTRDELAELAALVSADEWRRLVVHLPFLAASARSLEETREEMKKFLGRNPATGLVNPTTNDSEL